MPAHKLNRVFNPLEVIDIIQAIQKKEDRVRLRNRWFTIVYLKDSRVRIDPVDGFVPCGVWTIKELNEFTG